MEFQLALERGGLCGKSIMKNVLRKGRNIPSDEKGDRIYEINNDIKDDVNNYRWKRLCATKSAFKGFSIIIKLSIFLEAMLIYSTWRVFMVSTWKNLHSVIKREWHFHP